VILILKEKDSDYAGKDNKKSPPWGEDFLLCVLCVF